MRTLRALLGSMVAGERHGSQRDSMVFGDALDRLTDEAAADLHEAGKYLDALGDVVALRPGNGNLIARSLRGLAFHLDSAMYTLGRYRGNPMSRTASASIASRVASRHLATKTSVDVASKMEEYFNAMVDFEWSFRSLVGDFDRWLGMPSKGVRWTDGEREPRSAMYWESADIKTKDGGVVGVLVAFQYMSSPSVAFEISASNPSVVDTLEDVVRSLGFQNVRRTRSFPGLQASKKVGITGGRIDPSVVQGVEKVVLHIAKLAHGR